MYPKHPRQFLRYQLSLAATQPPIILQRQTHSKVEPKAELKQSTNMKEIPHVDGTGSRKEKKRNTMWKIAPGRVKAVCKIPQAVEHIFDYIYLITLKVQ